MGGKAGRAHTPRCVRPAAALRELHAALRVFPGLPHQPGSSGGERLASSPACAAREHGEQFGGVMSAYLSDALTPQQSRAVTARDVSVVLSSGAGCGKTHVLTQRYLSHLREGV